MGNNVNFTKTEEELINLMADAIIAEKNKNEIMMFIGEREEFDEITTSRFDYLYSIAKCKATFKDNKKLDFKERKGKTYKATKGKGETTKQVLKLLQKGLSVTDIATELNIKQSTVSYHKSRLIKENLYQEPTQATEEEPTQEIKEDKPIKKSEQVLELLQQGFKEIDISKKLNLAPHTVEYHIVNLIKEGLYTKEPKEDTLKDIDANREENKPEEIPITSQEENIPAKEIKEKEYEKPNTELIDEIDILLNNSKNDFKADENSDKVVINENITNNLEIKENDKQSEPVKAKKQKRNKTITEEFKYDMWEVCKQLIKNMDSIEAVMYNKAFQDMWEAAKDCTVEKINIVCDDLIKLMHEINIRRAGNEEL